MLTLISILLGASNSFATDHSIPPVRFDYSETYDETCARGFGYMDLEEAPKKSERLKPEWVEELKKRLPEFEQAWNQQGPSFLQILHGRFRTGFRDPIYVAYLSACESTPSMGFPLILNVSRFLKSFRAKKKPRDLKYFPVNLLHELLHVWLRANLPASTPLLKKFASENRTTRNHIHLIALQREIFAKLHRSDLLAFIERDYVRMGGSHKKAWDLVESEGIEKILDEVPIHVNDSGKGLVN